MLVLDAFLKICLEQSSVDEIFATVWCVDFPLDVERTKSAQKVAASRFALVTSNELIESVDSPENRNIQIIPCSDLRTFYLIVEEDESD